MHILPIIKLLRFRINYKTVDVILKIEADYIDKLVYAEIISLSQEI